MRDDVILERGPARAVVDPGRGGRLASLRVDDTELLITDDARPAGFGWGSFVMVPWAGRVRRGRFEHDGVTHQLDIDMPPHAIHGVAVDVRWEVLHQGTDDVSGDAAVELATTLDWPLGGRAWQRLTLSDARLRCELSVTAGDVSMPAEIGWHPWFVRPDSLQFRPEAMYQRDDEGIPDGQLVPPPPGPWDDCFVNTEPVLLRYPRLELTATSDCDHWVIYDEPLPSTCVEPQSGPPDAFTLRPHVLQPGRSLARWMRLSWRAVVA